MRGTACAFLATGFLAVTTRNTIIQPLAYGFTLRSVHNTSTSLVAVPFGTLSDVKFSEPSLVQTAGSDFDTNKIASDESWAKYKVKGNYYGCLLNISNENAGLETKKAPGIPPSVESVWRGDLQNELRNWGWHQAAYSPDINCDFRDELTLGTKNRIGTALSALGLSLLPANAGGDNECYSVEHFDETLVDEYGEEVPPKGQTYSIDGHTYPCTGAYYRFAMNKKGGAIFAQSLQKPESAARENLGGEISNDKLPQLNRASDVMWGYWIRSNPKPQNLYSYFVNDVRNNETLSLIVRALRNHGLKKVPYWPGLELKIYGEDAEAILGKFYVVLHWVFEHSLTFSSGSPIGSTIAHLLLQHKPVLGIKNFEGIVVFRDNIPEATPPDVQLLFKIIDVPQDDIDNSDTEITDASNIKLKRAILPQDSSSKNIIREHRVVVRLDVD